MRAPINPREKEDEEREGYKRKRRTGKEQSQFVITEHHALFSLLCWNYEFYGIAKIRYLEVKYLKTIQYNTIQNCNYNAVQHNTTQHNTPQHNPTQHNTLHCSAILHNSIQYNTVIAQQKDTLKQSVLAFSNDKSPSRT